MYRLYKLRLAFWLWWLGGREQVKNLDFRVACNEFVRSPQKAAMRHLGIKGWEQ